MRLYLKTAVSIHVHVFDLILEHMNCHRRLESIMDSIQVNCYIYENFIWIEPLL